MGTMVPHKLVFVSQYPTREILKKSDNLFVLIIYLIFILKCFFKMQVRPKQG